VHHSLGWEARVGAGPRLAFAASTGDASISSTAANQWTSALSADWRIPGLIVVAVVAYWPSSVGLWHYWTDDPGFGGYGLLVAGLALWLLWRARGRVAAQRVRGEPAALLLLVPCSVGSLIFWRAGIEALQFLMLPALILLAVWCASGPGVTRAVGVPVAFLYFAMPAWNLLAAPLQHLTLAVVTLLAPAIGLPAEVSGSSIYLPDDMKFNVELVCSGAGFLVQGAAVAVLVGELEDASPGRRLRLLGAMAVIALVTNWIRVLAIVQIGYATGMRHVLVTRHHLLFGYVLFVIVLVLFVWAARQPTPLHPPGAPVPPIPSGAVSAQYLMAVLALAAPPFLATVLAEGSARIGARELRLPAGRAGWSGPAETVDETWRPVFVGADDAWRGTYSDRSGHTVEVVAIGYGTQTHDRALVNEHNSLLGSPGLSLLATGRASASGKLYREDVAVDERGLHSVIWSVYVIGDRSFVTPLWARLWYGINAFGTPPYAALFAFRTSCLASCANGRAVLAEFLRVTRPQLFAAVKQPPTLQSAAPAGP